MPGKTDVTGTMRDNDRITELVTQFFGNFSPENSVIEISKLLPFGND